MNLLTGLSQFDSGATAVDVYVEYPCRYFPAGWLSICSCFCLFAPHTNGLEDRLESGQPVPHTHTHTHTHAQQYQRSASGLLAFATKQ